MIWKTVLYTNKKIYKSKMGDCKPIWAKYTTKTMWWKCLYNIKDTVNQ